MKHHEPRKSLETNPLRLSQPMGATLAYLGVKECMPLMHGAQGCASFTKVFYTRHYNEPIAIQTTAVNDVTAVLDGGDFGINEAVKNITAKVTPELIGLCTTGLTETKGDDVSAVARESAIPMVYANTPDYDGGFESGWMLAAKALVEQLTKETEKTEKGTIVFLPHASLQPIEVERLKELGEGFGFRCKALPDLSTSMDGHLEAGQGKLAGGGISKEEIEELATVEAAIAIGHSMKPVLDALVAKNSAIKPIFVPGIMGLEETDLLCGELYALRKGEPATNATRWRRRLEDAMLDVHFVLGKQKILIAGEADFAASAAKALAEVGVKVTAVVAANESEALKGLPAGETLVGDFGDVEARLDGCDALLANFHGARLAARHGKVHITAGFPDWEELGSALRHWSLYEGTARFLFDVANAIKRAHPHH